MEIRKINKSVNDLIQGAEYLGSGASKEAYAKNGIVYKVPRGRYLIENYGDLPTFPDTMEEVNSFLEKLYETIGEQMVWPIGQFAIELIIWKAIEQLEKEGLEINCFARIKDYYFDKNGVIVIEQELTRDFDYAIDGNEDDYDELYDNMRFEQKLLEPILFERFNIWLTDVRDGNCGLGKDGQLKLFDFGISSTTDLDSYGSYSCYENYSENYYYDYNSCESY